ncbi:hypothetical protein CWM47_31125 [Spirosoma pollinicola]|uniref:Uncharacterized protein n=2 Tax=Spirosoma pollinicola TaxID=2057025 RepID=A0A2K8Z7N9_9BACT|nr:hypothetical protein CWM47_31125 [Spirosoma pollinicola]
MANPYSVVFMKSTYSLDALGSILNAIKIYCYQTIYYRDLAEKQCINEYVNQALKGEDLLLWNCLRAQERAAFVASQESLPVDALSLRRFNLLLQRYKREGSAYYRFWQRAQATIRTELGVKISQV